MKMSNYLSKSRLHNHYDTQLVNAIDLAQNAWEAYASAHCTSVYTMWRDGLFVA